MKLLNLRRWKFDLGGWNRKSMNVAPRRATETNPTMRNTLTAIFISFTLMGICGLGRSIQSDPGHKADVTIDGIKFSCPKGFTVQKVSGFPTTRLMRNDRDKGGAGIFVTLPGKTINNEFIEEIATALASALLKKGAPYKWKRETGYGKVSKFETSDGRLLGFDGQKLVYFQYRLLSLDGRDVLVGQVFKLSEGEEANRDFDDGLGGVSPDCIAGASHVIASLTGEPYSDIRGVPPRIIRVIPPPKSLPQKN
jgi:hypothetical protein